ncbi:hypothetical protein PIB30_104206, partial [Stylosanthes scabra]|nr:hypothetical protein [Stylosanthes scabra]
MEKIAFILLFSLVLATPFRTALAQDFDSSWASFLGGGGLNQLNQDTIDQAKQALEASGTSVSDAANAAANSGSDQASAVQDLIASQGSSGATLNPSAMSDLVNKV